MFHAVGVRGFALLLGAFFAVTLLACSSLQSPESVVESYFKAVAENRVEEAVGYVALESILENDLAKAKRKFVLMTATQYAVIQNRGGLYSITTTLVDQDETTANVKAEMEYVNDDRVDRSTITLRKESGRWKIRVD